MNRLSLPLSWIAFSVALSLVASSPLAAQVVLSPRIGSTIDSLSREYFGLFPRLRGFREARLERTGHDVVVRVARAGAGDTTVTLSESVLTRLTEYGDHYEEILDGRRMLDTAVLQHVRPWRSWEVGPRVAVYTRAGAVHGTILQADEHGLIVVDSDTREYRPDVLNEHVTVLPASSIERVVAGGVVVPITGALLAWGGAVPPLMIASSEGHSIGTMASLPVGMLIGILLNETMGPSDMSLEGADWRAVLPKLQRNAMFSLVAPPELRRFADTVSRAEAAPTRRVEQLSPPSWLDRLARRSSLTLAITAPTSGEIHRYAVTGESPDSGTIELHDAPGWSAELSTELSSSVDLSVFAQKATGNVDADDDSYEAISRLDLAAVIDLLLTPRRRSGPQLTEALIGVGGGLVLADMEGRILSPSGKASQVVTQSSVVPLVVGRLTYRVNLFEWLAIQTSAIARWTGNVETGTYSYYHPNIDGAVRTAQQHAYPLSEVTAVVGLRVRLGAGGR